MNTFPPVLHVSVIRFWRVLLVLPPPPHLDARHSEKHNKDALCLCMRVSVLLRGFLDKLTLHQRQRTPYLQKHDVFRSDCFFIPRFSCDFQLPLFQRVSVASPKTTS